MEFTDKFTVGQPIKFRQKGAVGWERYLILNGYQHEQHEGRTVTYIYIGSQGYTLDALFNDYEWQTEACAVRHKFLCDASPKYKNKFEDHGNRNKMRQTKETFFSYAREKDTPFLLYGARYDSKIGLVLN